MAKQIAVQLEKSTFKTSNGWLDKWKKRYMYNVRGVVISGDVSGTTVQSWKEGLPVQGYSSETFVSCIY